MQLRKLATILILICLTGLSGCRTPAASRDVPWEKYDEPAPPVFTAEEKGFLDALGGVNSKEADDLVTQLKPDELETFKKFGVAASSALRKVMQIKNAYRATVRTHNKKAQEMYERRLKELGYSAEQMQRLTAHEKPAPD